MPRKVLDASRIHPAIHDRIADHHRDLIEEVEALLTAHPVVVVGMKQNPHPRRVLRALKEAGLPFHYAEYGTYFGQWRRRNVLKMWSGWPTFPMVFVKGVLIGGADETIDSIRSGEIGRLLAAG